VPGFGRLSGGAGTGVAVAVLALGTIVVAAAAPMSVRVDPEALGVLDAIAAALDES
jgi:hypothetical protein